MVIDPEDNTTLDVSHTIIVFFRWTGLGTDGFEPFFGHSDAISRCSSIFYEIASVHTAHGLATVTVHP
jgi:hypothetical protein